MTSSELGNFILGNYNLVEVLGVGAMGFVYRARQLNLERDVAVKILSPNLAHEVGYMDLFIREARTAASLEHPHIVPIFDYGIQDDISYVAMRLLPGGSLGDRISYRIEHGLPMPSLSEISQILIQAATALDYAHERGVIHRDIKPNNLMFDQHGASYVVDFGIAKLIGTSSSIKGSTFLGTPSFMAPEQWEGQSPTPAIDQYALAAVVYMMVTGRPPFESDIALALMKKHLSETPLDVREYRADASDAINAALRRAMAKQPIDRFANNRAFAQAFIEAVGDSEGKAATEFTSFLLPQSNFALPLPMPSKPVMARPETVPSPVIISRPATSSNRGRTIVIWIQSGLLVLAIVLIAILLARESNAGNGTSTQGVEIAALGGVSPTAVLVTPDVTAEVPGGDSTLVLVSQFTHTPVLLASASAVVSTPEPSATPTFTATVVLSITPSATPTDPPTATFSPTASASFTATVTPSHTPTATETSTETTTPNPTSGVVAPRPTVNWGAGTQLRINNASGVWLRTRPSGRAAQVATLANNNPVVATGNRQYDGRQWWWEVTAEWGAVGWVEQFALVQP